MCYLFVKFGAPSKASLHRDSPRQTYFWACPGPKTLPNLYTTIAGVGLSAAGPRPRSSGSGPYAAIPHAEIPAAKLQLLSSVSSVKVLCVTL